MGPICNCVNKSHSNILVLKCLGLVDSSRLMIVTPMPIMKLRFGLGIMPYKRLFGNYHIFLIFVHLILCD
jgi:hypothetical protein